METTSMLDPGVAQALERIATALEALARIKDRTFQPALPDPHLEERRAAQAKQEGKP
ncbi:hypothetical protein D3C83_178970 [compost metagenome]